MFYWVVGIIMFIFKGRPPLWQNSALTKPLSAGLNLPYPTVTLVGEMILLTVVCTIDVNRIFLGASSPALATLAGRLSHISTLAASRGNKTERVGSLGWSLVLYIFATVGHVYFVSLQVYV
jgi:hypothetical protein